ncbi:sensor histidine kinase [candidate division WOR-3 bacterium]|nr:sensor histidine kinase [candidate division WOR-3 bacterium]
MKGSYKFRPSARLIRTIGDDIIKDVYAAVIELIKNAYDADANNVELRFIDLASPEKARIIIKDDGHGMNYETVVNKWMVPATGDKVSRRKSPGGRYMQGRKGIGRFATSILGNTLLMETTDESGITTTVLIDWSIFSAEKYLDEIELLVESRTSGQKAGTELIIEPRERVFEWTEKEMELLIKEFRKLVSPIMEKEDFHIGIEFNNTGIDNYNNIQKKIEPFPMLELFDYRLSGEIDEKGNVSLVYENQVEKNIPPEKINFHVNLDKGKLCGPLALDFRVFDREARAIEDIIKRGLKDPDTGKYLGKLETRRLLNELCGVAVYRNGFRIRPYGEPGYDWLLLDKERVQNPSLKVGSDQIAGFITIADEEISHLEEKSARDGLKENNHYTGLVEIAKKCLAELEEQRFDFRRKTGRGRKVMKIETELKALFDFEILKNAIKRELRKSDVSPPTLTKIENIIEKTERRKIDTLEQIKDTVAMYQGQITLGKIIMVIMHEGRKPLKYLKEQSPRISRWIRELQEEYNTYLLDKIIDRLEDTKKESLLLIGLFNRLDPLAARKRGKRKNIDIYNVVKRAEELFKSELLREKIKFTNEVIPEVTFWGWEQDFYIALTNLIDNSLYWLPMSDDKKEMQITISSQYEDKTVIIDYRDNGPGIAEKYIEDALIFEPGFSTKPGGTGLGLAIAGETIEKNNGVLRALYDPEGAYFRIELPSGE